MSAPEGLYFTPQQATDFATSVPRTVPAIEELSTELHGALAAKVTEAGGTCDIAWPPRGPYRALFKIAKSNLNPEDTGYNVTTDQDLYPAYASQAARVGVSAGHVATLWVRDNTTTYGSRAARPLFPDEIRRLTSRIAEGRVVRPNQVAEGGKVYRRHGLRYAIHWLAQSAFKG